MTKERKPKRTLDEQIADLEKKKLGKAIVDKLPTLKQSLLSGDFAAALEEANALRSSIAELAPAAE